jgi:hypothetical protein
MKKLYTSIKKQFAHTANYLRQNFIAFFETGEKRDFQRLKDFITS